MMPFKFDKFNTGRGYTLEGQRIYYAWRKHVDHECFGLFDYYTVVFIDRDRNIDGYISVDQLTQDAIMREYDSNNYEMADIPKLKPIINQIKKHFKL